MERLYSLQGLRGAAVLGVVLFHMMSVEIKYSGGDILLPVMLNFFQLGVDLFFVISGFVMVIVSRGRFQKTVETQRFLFNRLSRIYPTYWLYFFITLGVYLWQPTLVNSSHGGSNLWMSFLLLPNDRVLLVMVAWSLLFELWFYLMFTLFLFFKEKRLPLILLLWAVALVVFNLLQNWQDYSPALKIVLHPYALEFIAGSALALFFYGPHSARVPTALVWAALAAALLVGFPLIYAYQLFFTEGLPRMLAVGLTFGTLTLSLALLERRQLIRMPGFLTATGDMSYTIYLSHLLVLGVVGRAWQVIGAWPESYVDNLAFIVLMMTAVVCYGWVGYHFYEKPILDRATAYCKRRFSTAPSGKHYDPVQSSGPSCLLGQPSMPKVLNANLDALKVLLAVMVVALHCKLLGGNYTWVGYLLCNGLFRVAVPTFFIINGYYLFQTLESGHSFAQWFKRGLLLYLFWMLVYSPQYVDPITIASLGGVLGVVKKLLIGYFHLWYLVGMLGGAAMLLVLRRWRSSALIGLALTAFLIGLGLQYARVYYELPNGFLQHFNQNDYTARNFLFMGFPFMAIGFLCARHRLAERLSRRGVCCWLVLGLGLILAEAALNFALRADVEQNFDFLASLLVIAPPLFLLPQVYFRASHSNFAAKLSSAVYYVHPWFIFGALSLGMAYGNAMAGLVLLLAFGVAPLLIMASRRVRFIL